MKNAIALLVHLLAGLAILLGTEVIHPGESMAVVIG
jgi:hypothetical protein